MNWITEIEVLLNSDVTSYELSKEIGLPIRFFDRYRKGESEIANMQLNKAKTLIEYIELKGETKMKKQLIIDNLNASYFDEADNIYELEFLLEGDKVVVVRVNADDFEGAANDEYYWDDEKNVTRAVEQGDIDVMTDE